MYEGASKEDPHGLVHCTDRCEQEDEERGKAVSERIWYDLPF